jgi:4-hydroxybenzoate polyprenyltransferase
VRRLAVYLRLGRVSNLPTVWTNVLAGAVLAGAPLQPRTIAVLLVALSLVYTAGMFLNDAFDRRFDAQHRADRPIPQGLVTPLEVFAVGYGLLGAGSLLLVAYGAAFWAGLALAATVVLYDAWHKTNPLSPALMALCRALVYVTAALAVSGTVRPAVLIGAGVMFAYLIALTWWAKRGGSHVAWLIAGISLVDGAAMLAAGRPLVAASGIIGFALTLRLQRRVQGT